MIFRWQKLAVKLLNVADNFIIFRHLKLTMEKMYQTDPMVVCERCGKQFLSFDQTIEHAVESNHSSYSEILMALPKYRKARVGEFVQVIVLKRIKYKLELE